MSEHYRSHHHNNQVPTDQFVMNRPDVAPTSRPIRNSLYHPSYAAFGLPVDPFLRALKQNPNFPMPKVRSDERSTTNNIRTDNAPSRVPTLHQSSSHSGREVVEQEHGQSMGDYPRVIRPIPTRPYNPSCAAIGLPVDTFLRALKRNPNFSMPKVRSDERSTTNNIRADNAPSRVPALHQSSSHSGREVVEQEHGQSMGDDPRVIRPIPTRPYDPSCAAIGLPVDTFLRALKRNPNFSMPKVRCDERSTTNNIRTDNAPSGVPMLHQSSSHSGREFVKQEHGQSMGDYPRVISPIPTRPYDPSSAAIGLPVDPFLRAFKRNPNFPMPKVRSDKRSSTTNTRTDNAPSGVPMLHQSSSHSGNEVVEQEHGQSMGDNPRVINPIPTRPYDPSSAAIGLPVDPFLSAFKRNPNFPMPKVRSDERSSTNNTRTDNAPSGVPMLHQSSSHSGNEVAEQEHGQSMGDYRRVISPIPTRPYDPSSAAIGLPVDPFLPAFKRNPNFPMPKVRSDERSTTNNIRTDNAPSRVPTLHQSSSHSGRDVVGQEHGQGMGDYPRVIRPIPTRPYDPSYAAIGPPVNPLLRAFKQNPNFGLPKGDE